MHGFEIFPPYEAVLINDCITPGTICIPQIEAALLTFLPRIKLMPGPISTTKIEAACPSYQPMSLETMVLMNFR